MDNVIQMQPAHLRRFTKPLMMGGKNAEHLFGAGVLHQEEGDEKKALRCFRAAMDAGYHSADLYLRMGFIESDGDNHRCWERARHFFQLALDIEESNEFANFGMGEVLESLGEFKKAKEYYLYTLEINPRFHECQFKLARLCQIGSDYFPAIRHWNAYIQCVPDHAAKSVGKEQKRACVLCVTVKR